MPTTITTTDEIGEQIMDLLTDGNVHAWAELRANLPGTLNQQADVLCALAADGRVDAWKHDGRNYLAEPLAMGAVA